MTERTLDREAFVRLLELVYEMEEARACTAGYARVDLEHAATTIGLPPGAVTRAMDRNAEARQRWSSEWLGARTALCLSIRSDDILAAEGMGRLAELLPALGGITRSVGEDLAAGTEDGVQVRIRSGPRGTEITVASDRRGEVVGAAIGMTALTGGGVFLGIEALALSTAPALLGAIATGLFAGWLSLRLYLRRAEAGWRDRLDQVGRQVDALVRRAGATREAEPS